MKVFRRRLSVIALIMLLFSVQPVIPEMIALGITEQTAAMAKPAPKVTLAVAAETAKQIVPVNQPIAAPSQKLDQFHIPVGSM